MSAVQGHPVRMRLATWNVNSVRARLPRLLDWLDRVQPDVVCLQETRMAAAAFPREELHSRGYEVAVHGDAQWNGVAIVSRVGIDDVDRGFPREPGFPDPESRAIAATCRGLRVWSVYVPNGRSLDDPHFAYKLAWLTALRDALAAETAAARPFGLCGDSTSRPPITMSVDPAAFTGSTHVSPAEREALAGLLRLGLTDVRPRAVKGPQPFTYWDYRSGMFHRGLGMRIDLVLANAALASAVRDAYVDRDARKGPLPSDHAPVVVELDLPPAGFPLS
jgi:exodeoxyribonuclease-3